jgi:hypothetical protein
MLTMPDHIENANQNHVNIHGRDFNNPPSPIDRSSRKKSTKKFYT